MDENNIETRTVGTRLSDLLLQKNISYGDTAHYETEITALNSEKNTLKKENKAISEELAHQKAYYETEIASLNQENKALKEENKAISEELAHQKAIILKMEKDTLPMVQSLFDKAIIALKQENYIDAMGLLQAVLIHDPENIKAMINLSVVYAEFGYQGKAVETLQMVLQKEPENETAKRNLEILEE